MAEYIKQDEFISIATEQGCDANRIIKYIKTELNPDYAVNSTNINNRIANYRRKGLLPLDSGNQIDTGTILRGTSTHYDDTGRIISQWVKTDVPKEQSLEAFTQAVENIANKIESIQPTRSPDISTEMKDLLTLYPLGDPHIGMLAHHEEVGEDNDLNIITQRLSRAMQLSVDMAMPTQTAFIVDTGELIAA